MRLFINRLVTEKRTKSLFGSLAIGDSKPSLAVCERWWQGNKPNLSCFPDGFYRLVSHQGTEYPRTVAFVGSTVSHHGGEVGTKRTVCVAHWSQNGLGLKGCQAWADRVDWNPDGTSKLVGKESGRWLVDDIRARIQNGEDVYCTITGGNTE